MSDPWTCAVAASAAYAVGVLVGRWVERRQTKVPQQESDCAVEDVDVNATFTLREYRERLGRSYHTTRLRVVEYRKTGRVILCGTTPNLGARGRDENLYEWTSAADAKAWLDGGCPR